MPKRYHEGYRKQANMRDSVSHKAVRGEERDGNRHKDSGDLGPEYYSGAAARYAMERKDAGMIHENHNAVANLPQEVMIKPWPMAPGYLPEMLDDGISGIDRQLSLDNAQKRKGFDPKKI